MGDVVGYYTQPMYASYWPGWEGLAHHSGVLGVTNPATGYYYVKFVRPVAGCNAQVSEYEWAVNRFIKADVNYSGLSETGVAKGPDEVAVVVRNTSGALENGPFHIRLVC